MAKKFICTKHEDAIFEINSTVDEWSLYYHNQILDLLSHLEKNHGKGCLIAPVEFRKASEL